MNILGKEIPRADEKVIKALMDKGILYVGDDDQLHVVERVSNENKRK